MDSDGLPEEVTVRQTEKWSSQVSEQGGDGFQVEGPAHVKTLGQEWAWHVQGWHGGRGSWHAVRRVGQIAGALEAIGRASDVTQSVMKRHRRVFCREVTWLDECFESIILCAV